jgi:chromosome segregation protein
MRLNKIEIQGFKSFYDYQSLEFKPGVTGIVGPNGCGKSNIGDAIAWVLGSQSAPQLRGKRMDDLIFNGSRNRKPLGMAQVIITMYNENGDDHKDSEILQIGRRLFRTGESEYVLNGKECRLRDVQELIMDTGLGTSVYTVIEQGKIDQILSQNSADRRDLLEEAAGITRFKAKRHQTGLKLQATRQNLVRLYDVMNEIEKQVRSLAGQAAKARRYKRLHAEQTDYQLLIYIERYFKLFSQQEEVLRRISSLKDHEARTSSSMASSEAENEEMKLGLIDAEAELKKLNENLFQLEIDVNSMKAKTEENGVRIADLSLLIDRNKLKTTELDGKLVERKESISTQEKTLIILDGSLAARQTELDSTLSHLSAKKDSHRLLEISWEESGRKHLDTLNRFAEIQSQLVKTGTELDQHKARKVRNLSELAEMEKDLASVEKSFIEEEKNQAGLESELKNLNSRSADLSGKTTVLKEEISEKTGNLLKLREAITRLSSEIETIRKMQWADPGRHTAGEFLLEKCKSVEYNIEGLLLEQFAISEKYRLAAERYLEDSIRNFIATDLKSALRLASLLDENKKGRAAIIVRDILDKKNPFRTLDADGKKNVLTTLHRELNGIGGFAHLLTRIIPDAYIVEEIADFESISGLLNEADVISLKGNILTGKGVLICGDEGSEAPRLLDLQEIIRTKSSELDSDQLKLKDLEAEERKLLKQHEEFERELSELEIRINETKRRCSVGEEKLKRIEEERARLRIKRDMLENEDDQLSKEGDVLSAEYEKLDVLRNSLSAERDEHLKNRDEIRKVLEETKNVLDKAGENHSQIQEDFNRLRAEKQNCENNIFHLREAVLDLERQISEKNQESGDADKKIIQLREETAVIEEECGVKSAELATIRETYSQKELSVKDRQGRVIEREQYLKSVRRQHEEEVKSINRLEIELTEISVSLKNIEENCRNELGRTIGDYTGLFTAPEIMEAIAEIQEKNTEVKLKIQKLGEVNPIAYEEYEKAKKRLKFYREQEKDLTGSIDSLEKVITKLEDESRKRFIEAFNQINANFKEIFSHLFDGGRSELTLPEGEDILECPILITAQPPGKRLQSISLLSGGEKAMVSIALLFGIFRYKPSPFCILDEVDASLDEVNTNRFIKMIKEYSDKTQFILITHNKRTMETASVLYGVTMEEPGLSKLVSVSFGDQADSLKGAR